LILGEPLARMAGISCPFHNTPLFRMEARQEWLFYFQPKCKRLIQLEWDSFLLSIRAPDGQVKETLGTLRDFKAWNLDLTMEFFGTKIGLNAIQIETATIDTLYKFPLSGEWSVNDVPLGSCEISPHNPMVEFNDLSGRSLVYANCTMPQLGRSPVMVNGVPDCEVLLDTYSDLAPKQRKALPRDIKPQKFVGSLRTNSAAAKPFEAPYWELIPMVIAIYGLILVPGYMSTDAS
jgi:hypothetical protein